MRFWAIRATAPAFPQTAGGKRGMRHAISCRSCSHDDEQNGLNDRLWLSLDQDLQGNGNAPRVLFGVAHHAGNRLGSFTRGLVQEQNGRMARSG